MDCKKVMDYLTIFVHHGVAQPVVFVKKHVNSNLEVKEK
jgi:hypothetical protein